MRPVCGGDGALTFSRRREGALFREFRQRRARLILTTAAPILPLRTGPLWRACL